MNEDRQGSFFSWLASSVSSAQLSELYQAFTDLESIISSDRYMHNLSQSIIETTDAEAVDQLYNDLSANKQFMRSYRSGVKLSLLRHYARFCQETQGLTQSKRTTKKASSKDALLARLKKDGIRYTDNRAQNGALWIYQSPYTDALIRDARAAGVHFAFSDSKQQWWTRDASPQKIGESVKQQPDLVSLSQYDATIGSDLKKVSGSQKAAGNLILEVGFRKWLKTNKPDEDADQLVMAIRRAEQFADRALNIEAKMLNVEYSVMESAINRMSSSREFIKSNSRTYGRFRRAAELLVKYSASLSTSVNDETSSVLVSDTTQKPETKQLKKSIKESKPDLEPSLFALLQSSQMSVLREALVQKGIHTLDSFKKLNLWVFMNQNGLYSIGERQKVYSSLRRALNAEGATGSDAQVKIVTCENEYLGSSPADALLDYLRAIASRYPLRFRGLIGQRMVNSDVVPLSHAAVYPDDLHMDNPKVYLRREIGTDYVLDCAKWIATMCRDTDIPQAVVTKDQANGNGGKAKGDEDFPILKQDHSSGQEGNSTQEKPTLPSKLQTQVEQLVLAADLEGLTLDQLYAKMENVTMVALKQIRDRSLKLVDIADRLIHVDAFVDWDEGAQKLDEILDKLLAKNNGYVSYSQLYEYARAEMQMFLNDNDMDDPRKVFDMAEHLFEKEGYHNKRYTFWMKTHISRSKESVTSNLDVIKKFARDHNGFFRYDELVEYLEQVGIKTGNLRGQMQLGHRPYFFYYSSEEILSAEDMKINKAWLDQAEKALGRLFADVGDHVVLRSINPIWYEQMPTLPSYLPWTPLLLQYILHFYGKKLGAKTIASELSQKYDVLHAMLVTPNSEVQTFADAVVAHLVDSGISERQFEAEELRGKLVDGGLIAGNELISHMPKAIGSDPRFAWDASGRKVSIKV